MQSEQIILGKKLVNVLYPQNLLCEYKRQISGSIIGQVDNLQSGFEGFIFMKNSLIDKVGGDKVGGKVDGNEM